MLDKLKQLGLSEYEAKIYLTLLKEGSLTGGKLSKLSQVPHGKTYEALSKLEEKGFISITPLKPKLFKAIKPEIAIKHLVSEKISKFDELKKETLTQLKGLKKGKVEETAELITVVAGMKALWQLVEHMTKTTEKNYKVMITYELRPFSIIREMYEAVKRGVNVKIIATKLSKQGKKWISEDKKAGIKVKYYPVKELRLSIKDSSEALQTIINPRNPSDRITIHIQTPELVKALDNYFETIWKKAKHIK